MAEEDITKIANGDLSGGDIAWKMEEINSTVPEVVIVVTTGVIPASLRERNIQSTAASMKQNINHTNAPETSLKDWLGLLGSQLNKI